MPRSETDIRAIAASLRAYAGMGLAALWHADAREPRPARTRIVLDGGPPRIEGPGGTASCSPETLADLKPGEVDLVFAGPSAIDIETVVPDAPRERTLLDCEDMVTDQSPFPEEDSLCFWTARRWDGVWHVTAAVTLAKPVLALQDMLDAASVRIRAVRRHPDGDGAVWVAVPPWIRTERKRIPSVPPWAACLASAVLLLAASAAYATVQRTTALETAERAARADRALIARLSAETRERDRRETDRAASRERIALAGRLAAALPDTISLTRLTVDGATVQMQARGGSSANAVRIVTTLDGVASARIVGDVRHADAGEIFGIEAKLDEVAQ